MTTLPVDSSKEKKMDWMYRDSSQVVDPEEYLLGRKVDKQFEKSALPPDKDQEPLPTSIFLGSAVDSQVDIARKLQEDPLFLIKKKEMESRQQLLKNPRKMKQLQEMLARQQAASEKLRKKQMKKSKKLKKNKDLDALLAKKCKQLLGGFDLKKLDAIESDTSTESSSSNDFKSNKHKKRKNNKDLDKVLALKYKKLLGKVDQKVLDEISSSSGSESSSTEKSSESNCSSDHQRRKQVSSNDGEKLKRKRIKKERESRKRESSSDSQVSKERVKQKVHHKSKVLPESRKVSRDVHTRSSYDDDEGGKYSKRRKESGESKSRHERYQDEHHEESRTHTDRLKSKQKDDKHNFKEDNKHKLQDNKHSRKKGHESDSSSNEIRSKKDKSPDKRRKDKEKKKSSKPTDSSSSETDTSTDREKNQAKKQYGLVLPANYVPKKKSENETKKFSQKVTTEVKPYRREEKRKLTEEEKELRLKEMMSNAKWRDDLRDTNIKNYQKKLDAEKDNYVYNEEFMRNQMSYAMSQGTVESRVKAKINTIQRSKGSMSENFARRN